MVDFHAELYHLYPGFESRTPCFMTANDRARAEKELRRRLGDAYAYLTAKEKEEQIQALLRNPRRN